MLVTAARVDLPHTVHPPALPVRSVPDARVAVIAPFATDLTPRRHGVPAVGVAPRTPFDLIAYPSVGTAVATYGIQAPNLEALAAAILGRMPFQGRPPVRLDPELMGERR